MKLIGLASDHAGFALKQKVGNIKTSAHILPTVATTQTLHTRWHLP